MRTSKADAGNTKRVQTPAHELVERAKQTLNLDNRIGLNRVEAAAVLGFRNPITIDRLALRGLLKPSLATRRPIYSVEELKRFLRETTADTEPKE